MRKTATKGRGLFIQVLTGLLIGIAAGLFFGESAESVKIFGDAYIGLLQMSVIPFVVVSLITGLGRLEPKTAVTILWRTALAVLVLWTLIIFTAAFIPLGFPDWDSASFFSVSLIEVREPVDFLGIYIPANPFNALASGTVPAIVLFSIAVGIAIMGIPGKEALLDPLDRFGDAISRIAGFVVRLAPIGVFAIAASAAGTIRVDEFDRLQVYFFTTLLAWIILTFWTLPMFVASRSPVSMRSIVRRSRAPLLTAFATGSLLVVLPMLAVTVKQILDDNGLATADDATVDIIVPASYSVPSGGLFLSIAFVLFAAWATGAPLDAAQIPAVAAVGAATAFSGTQIAIPYLLDVFHIPSDMFQLFLASNVILGRLWTMFAALFIILLTLIVSLNMNGRFRWLPRVPFGFLAPTAVGTVLLLFLAGEGLERTIDHEYGKYETFVNRDLLSARAAVRQLDDQPAALGVGDIGRSRLDVIRERGTIRVAYLPDSLPYAYRNNVGRVVGLDIELAHVLARDLDVTLDLVRIGWNDIVPSLNTGRIDIVMSGLLVSPELAQQVLFTDSYLTEHGAFIVLDHRRHEFSDFDKVQQLGPLRIGYPVRGVYSEWLSEFFPNFEVVPLSSARPFFRDPTLEVDALFYTAERGSAWTLLYPDYSVVIPRPFSDSGPLAYAIPSGQDRFLSYLNAWLAYETPNRVPLIFAHWVQGEAPFGRKPRWSIRDNVLGRDDDDVR